jgi:hypothetical protein
MPALAVDQPTGLRTHRHPHPPPDETGIPGLMARTFSRDAIYILLNALSGLYRV